MLGALILTGAAQIHVYVHVYSDGGWMKQMER